MPLLDEQVRQIAHEGRSIRARVVRLIQQLWEPHRLAVRIFMPDGVLSRDAAEWFARLAAENYVNTSTYHEDPREHALREGQRRLALKIMGSVKLDVAKLARLQAQLEEAEHE